ncbi:MAG: hypothetical protein C7B46_20480 [Sulfobacillus benefaciens]|uniref:Uncharacterized protein n=1 Tax=Sulfobacillus benefaciens TaxID=453960 RepID=A0A2T2WUG4_9FIRM|nr:MAG: hypothetical protein C7B46_20480 [Sulfobacillus benefaciens]
MTLGPAHDLSPFPLLGVVFHCTDCSRTVRMTDLDADPTNAAGGCPTCGSARWHIFYKTLDGAVHRV